MRWLTLLALAAIMPLAGIRAADAPHGKIVYSRTDGDRHQLHVMNADGTDDQLLAGQTADASLFPVWSPDGKRIAFMAGPKLEGEEYQLQIINADGTGLKTLPTQEKLSGLPAWSPDGKQLAYVSGQREPQVYLADAEGNGVRKISPEGSVGFFPFWSLDGKRVGFTRAVRNAGEEKSSIIWYRLEDGATEELLGADNKLVMACANGLSPEGTRLLYTSIDPHDNRAQLCIRDLENKGDIFLSDLKLEKLRGPNTFPFASWAPDGKSFLVALSSPKGWGIYRVNEDGSEKKRLTPEGVDCFTASWHGGK